MDATNPHSLHSNALPAGGAGSPFGTLALDFVVHVYTSVRVRSEVTVCSSESPSFGSPRGLLTQTNFLSHSTRYIRMDRRPTSLVATSPAELSPLYCICAFFSSGGDQLMISLNSSNVIVSLPEVVAAA